MNRTVFRSVTILDRNSYEENMRIVCENGRIVDISPERNDEHIDAVMVDGQGRYLTPGLIDLHIHGTNGLYADSGPRELEDMCKVLPQYGVTGFLPTVMPSENDVGLLRSLSLVRSKGAAVFGFFLEGHYLKLTGAIKSLQKDYSPDTVHELKTAAKPYPVIFGISPEIPGITELLPLMTEGGLPAFITHTMATVEQTEACIKAGACHATHFYNVFPYPGDREPGVRGCGAVEAVLAAKDTSVDFILDGVHVHESAVRVALQCKGLDRVCLITDANICAGLQSGIHLGKDGMPWTVQKQGTPARELTKEGKPGVLYGSGLTMDRAVRNAVKFLYLPIEQAVAMGSYNPARVLGLHSRKGLIAPGFDADLVIMDNSLVPCQTFVCGEKVFNREESTRSK